MTLMTRRFAHHSARIDLWLGGTGVVRMSGVMREENITAWLLPLIDQIHETAIGAHLREVILDIRALEYANTALWRCLVRWVKRLREESASYNLRIVSDPMYAWQQVGVPMLRAFSLSARGGERLIFDEASP